ncbi:MAG: nicotinate-nucleotide adenylyltransferase [Deltaproteobacteria bacterium]|jgi:nicotinate-nucleotide adenylyltransferase|nr:nicotinate-nucleotide adenylyltransferase [Deltaproteobacteria bacterium]
MANERIGLFGGTFDPIHFGHLRVAEELAIHLKLDRVLFIPAAQQPHKPRHGPVDFKHRLAMLELAINERAGFETSDIEAGLPLPSYTVNTVRALKQKEAGELIFLVGYDSFSHIKSWRGYKELMDMTAMAVFQRPGTVGDRRSLLSLLGEAIGTPPEWEPSVGAFVWPDRPCIYYYEGCRLHISSTDLRQRLAAGDSVRYLLPEAVRDYLNKRGLYSPNN